MNNSSRLSIDVPYLLKEVADTKSEALPAEACTGENGEQRTPVQGELQREAEAVLQTNLCANAKAHIRVLAETCPNLCGRSYIEIERAEGSH